MHKSTKEYKLWRHEEIEIVTSQNITKNKMVYISTQVIGQYKLQQIEQPLDDVFKWKTTSTRS